MKKNLPIRPFKVFLLLFAFAYLSIPHSSLHSASDNAETLQKGVEVIGSVDANLEQMPAILQAETNNNSDNQLNTRQDCDDEPPLYYNHTEVVCDLNDLVGKCLTLQEQNAFLPNQPWSPYTRCGCCVLNNPAWMTFAVPDSGDLHIAVEISNCISGAGSEGVQIALYELDGGVGFDTTGQSTGLWPAGPDSHISPCPYIQIPQLGVVTFEAKVAAGQLYGILVDGWNGWNCNVEVIEVLMDGEAPAHGIEFVGMPEWDTSSNFFQAGDTVSTGSQQVPFSIGEGVHGASYYTWILDGEIIEDFNSTEAFLDFPQEGVFELCVFGFNPCDSGDTLCVEVVVADITDVPQECDDEPPFYYNHTEVVCDLNDLVGRFLTLQDLDAFHPNEHWVPYTHCECCVFHNPAWMSLVVPDSGELYIDVEISNCISGSAAQGVQIALYELDAGVDFDTTGQSTGLWPDGPDSHISPCQYIQIPQFGVVTFEAEVAAGQLYGIVVDGWNGWNCKVEVLEVLLNGEPPEPEIDLLGKPEGDTASDVFQSGDTVCTGVEQIPFSIGEGIPDATFYTWTLDGEILEDFDSTVAFLDFPQEGLYEVCVFASSLCESGDTLCAEVVVNDTIIDSLFTRDTICMSEEYVWASPYGLVGERIYGPFNLETEHLDTTFHAENTTFGCELDAILELFIIGDNYFNPTELEAVICHGDTFYIPGQGHPEAMAFDATGVYGLDRDVFLTQAGEPGSMYQCDSFFVLDLAVISLDVLGFFEGCVDSVFTICTQFPGVIFPDMGLHDLDTEFTWEWVRMSDGEVLATGDNSMGNIICVDLPESVFLNPEEENLEFRMNAHIDGEPGPDGCDFSVPFTVPLVNYLPFTPVVDVEGEFLQGDLIPIEITNPQATVDYEWSFSQQPDIFHWAPNHHTLQVSFAEAGIIEACVTAVTHCASSETHCFEIEIETDVSVPPAATQKHELEWFPNPVTDMLHMRSDTPLGETEVQVYDTRGVLVYQGIEDIGEEYQFSTAHLQSGVYVIRLVFEDGIGLHKMVVQK